jgi:uncharacterized membrane protein
MTNYLRAFVIGSSFPVFLLHFVTVAGLDERRLNYTYKQYSFIAPLYYGVMNVLSLYIAFILKLTDRQRYLLIGVLSPFIVISFSYIFETYDYQGNEWVNYGVGLFIKHFLIWNIIVYFLNRYV